MLSGVGTRSPVAEVAGDVDGTGGAAGVAPDWAAGAAGAAVPAAVATGSVAGAASIKNRRGRAGKSGERPGSFSMGIGDLRGQGCQRRSAMLTPVVSAQPQKSCFRAAEPDAAGGDAVSLPTK